MTVRVARQFSHASALAAGLIAAAVHLGEWARCSARRLLTTPN